MVHLLLVFGIAGLVTSTMYASLAALGALRFALRRRRQLPCAFQPPVSLLKPLHGAEPGLEAHLGSFFAQDYPCFEILFCARSDRDPGLEVARRVSARYPQIRVKFLTSGNPLCANAKVWSLQCMQDSAAHAIFVISDSDASVKPGYLRAVIAPFTDERVGLVTCLYRGMAGSREATKGSSLWSRLEAEGMSVEMSSGVLVAEMLEGMKFALGPTMAVRRECVEGFGGFGVLGRYHADDFMLGNLVAANGHSVILSTHVIDHHILNNSLLSSFRHQVRWMKSTRFSRPKGHLGTALTFSMPYAILAAGAALAWHRPSTAFLLFAWGWATRLGLAALMSGLVVEQFGLLRSLLLYPLRDLFSFFYWAASYLGNDVQWRGEVYQLLEGGSMRNDSPDPNAEAVRTT